MLPALCARHAARCPEGRCRHDANRRPGHHFPAAASDDRPRAGFAGSRRGNDIVWEGHTVTGYDAIVVGAGHNGLVAANLLADAGWSVLVLEAQSTPGGAVRSADILGPGYTTDLFSAFYPLGAASPVLRGLRLQEYGLQWTHAPAVLAHLLPDGRSVVMSRDLEATAASVDAFAPGDGDAWRELV